MTRKTENPAAAAAVIAAAVAEEPAIAVIDDMGGMSCAERRNSERNEAAGQEDHRAAQDPDGYHSGNPHNCCKEIYYEAVKKDPSIGIATVYRMMNLLEEIGAVSRFYSYPMYQTNEDMADTVESGISIRNGKTITPRNRKSCMSR